MNGAAGNIIVIAIHLTTEDTAAAPFSVLSTGGCRGCHRASAASFPSQRALTGLDTRWVLSP